MNIVDFTKNINHTNYGMNDIITEFFVQFLGLYITLNSWQIWVDIISRVEDDNLIYTIKLKNKKDIDKFVSVLNTTPITMYGTGFEINTVRTGDMVDICLIKKACR